MPSAARFISPSWHARTTPARARSRTRAASSQRTCRSSNAPPFAPLFAVRSVFHPSRSSRVRMGSSQLALGSKRSSEGVQVSRACDQRDRDLSGRHSTAERRDRSHRLALGAARHRGRQQQRQNCKLWVSNAYRHVSKEKELTADVFLQTDDNEGKRRATCRAVWHAALDARRQRLVVVCKIDSSLHLDLEMGFKLSFS